MKMQYLLINSEDRLSSSTSSADATIDLKRVIPSARGLRLVHAMIPNNTYNIVTGANDKLDFARGGTDYSITIPAGGYTITDLLDQIETLMNAADANNYVVSLSTTTFKVTITGTGAFTLEWSTGTNAGTNVHTEIGFGDDDTASATSHTGSYATSLARPRYLYVQLPQYESFQVDSAQNYYHFHIPITEDAGNVVVYEPSHPQTLEFSQVQAIQPLLRVKLLQRNRSGTGVDTVNLNGSDWTLVFEVLH